MEEVKYQKINKFKTCHFIAYCINSFLQGIIISSFGPMIPYLAARDNLNQTQYSYLFIFRAIGAICSGFLIKLISIKLSQHTIIIISCILVAVFSIPFSLLQLPSLLGTSFLLLSLFNGCMEVSISVSWMEVVFGHNQQKLANIINGIFGLGGLVGPFIVFLFETYTYIAVGAMLTLSTLPFFILQSPEINAQKQINVDLVKQVPTGVQYRIYLLIFLYIGMEITFGGWISPYAVIQKVSNKQKAIIYTSIFWLTITVTRFIIAFIPGNITFKLQFLTLSMMIFALATSILAYLQIYQISILISCISFGICLSSLYGFILILPSEFNLKFTVNQRSNCMISSSLGEAVLASIIGYSMQIINPNMLFYSILFVSMIFAILTFNTLHRIEQQINYQSQLEQY